MEDNSVKNIYHALKKALQDDTKRKKAQELSYERLKKEFTWERTTDNLERIVEN